MEGTTCGAVNQSLCHPVYSRTTMEEWSTYMKTLNYIIYVALRSKGACVFNGVWYAAIFVFGTIGAIFTVIVIWRDLELRKTVFYRILSVEALFEGLACVGAFVGHGSISGWWTDDEKKATTIHGRSVEYHTSPNWFLWVLKIVAYDFYRMGDVAAYLLLFMSVDRFLGTLFPLKYHVAMTKKRSGVVFWVAMIITAFAFILEIRPFLSVPLIGYTNDTNGTLTTEYQVYAHASTITDSELVKDLLQVWVEVRDHTNWVKMPIVLLFLPLSSMLIGMRLRKKDEQNHDYKKKRNAFRMLVITSALTVLLYIPRIIYNVLRKVLRDWEKNPMAVGLSYYTWRYCYYIAIFLGNWMEVTYALNFYVMYALIGSFRKSANRYLFKKKEDGNGNGNGTSVGIASRSMASFKSTRKVHPLTDSPGDGCHTNANTVKVDGDEMEIAM